MLGLLAVHLNNRASRKRGPTLEMGEIGALSLLEKRELREGIVPHKGKTATKSKSNLLSILIG